MSAKARKPSAGGDTLDGIESAPSPSSASATTPKSSLQAPSTPANSKTPRLKPPSVESILLEEALLVEEGEEIAVACVSSIVKAAMDKLTQHYVQDVAMKTTAKQAIDFVLQALEWQLLAHDDGEKLTVRKILAEKQTNPELESESAANYTSKGDDDESAAPRPMTPSPIDEPNNRSRPALDIIASKLSLPTTYNQIWTCEEEPQPADLDRWARGSLPTKQTQMSMAMPGGMGMAGGFTVVHEADEGSSTPRSTTSSTTPTHSRLGHFRSPTRGSSAGSQSGSNGNGRPSSHKKHRSIAEEKDANGNNAVTNRPPQPFPLEVVVSKESLAKEKSRESDLRRLEKKKRAEAEIARNRAADAAERDRMERIQSDLRHRSYTFDSRGNVILIAPLPVERLPPFQATPKIQVKEEYLTDEQEEEIRKREKRNRFKKAGLTNTLNSPTSLAINKSSSSATDEKTSPPTPMPPISPHKSASIGMGQKKSPKKPDFTSFIDLNATQPSLMSTLNLAKGVTLKQGALSKTFDPRAQSNNHYSTLNDGTVVDNQAADLKGLTRKEYLQRLQLKSQSGSSTLPPKVSNTLPLSSAPVSSSYQSHTNGDSTNSRPASGSYHQTASPVTISPKGSTEELRNNQDQIDSSDNYQDEYIDGENDNADEDGAYSSPSHFGYRRPTATEQFNLALTQDPMWGMNPPSLGPSSTIPRSTSPPTRPSPHDRLLAVGRRAKNPRDRADRETTLNQSRPRQHLPPPPVGAVTRHDNHDNMRSRSTSPTPSSPSPSFTKLPPPTNIIATDKAKLYFRQQ